MNLVLPKFYELANFVEQFKPNEIVIFGDLFLSKNDNYVYVLNYYTVLQKVSTCSISYEIQENELYKEDHLYTIEDILQRNSKLSIANVIPFGFSIHSHPGDFGFSQTDLSLNGIVNRFQPYIVDSIDLVMGKTKPIVDLRSDRFKVNTIYCEISPNMWVVIVPPYWSFSIQSDKSYHLNVRLSLNKDHIKVHSKQL